MNPDKAIRIRILAGILMKMCLINDEKVSEMYISLLHSPELEFPDRVLVSIVSVIFDLPIDNLVCERQGSTNDAVSKPRHHLSKGPCCLVTGPLVDP